MAIFHCDSIAHCTHGKNDTQKKKMLKTIEVDGWGELGEIEEQQV